MSGVWETRSRCFTVNVIEFAETPLQNWSGSSAVRRNKESTKARFQTCCCCPCPHLSHTTKEHPSQEPSSRKNSQQQQQKQQTTTNNHSEQKPSRPRTHAFSPPVIPLPPYLAGCFLGKQAFLLRFNCGCAAQDATTQTQEQRVEL